MTYFWWYDKKEGMCQKLKSLDSGFVLTHLSLHESYNEVLTGHLKECLCSMCRVFII